MRATRLSACVFVATPSSRVLVLDVSGNAVDTRPEELTAAEANAYTAMQDAFNQTVTKLGKFNYDNWICPWDWSNNNVITAQNGLFVFPAAIITAEYPDGRQKMYVLGKDFTDKLTGGIWKPDRIYPYLRTLLLDETPKQQSDTFICRLLPPLCSVGGWMWLALAIGATWRAYDRKSLVYGAASALLWKEWYDRGGLDQVKNAAGIGKYYDDVTIKPGSRVDAYWDGLTPSPTWAGVESYQAKHFVSVPDAIKNFGLYSIEFGNWLNQAYRLNFMYATMVTLRDMAEVLGVKQSGMGLQKKLSLAFGSRGKGGFAAAFYQGNYKVINLTKTKGRGTFCHEYGHAVDDHLGWPSGARSVRRQPDYTGKRAGSAAFLMEKVLDKILWDEDGNPSSYQRFLDKEDSEYLNRRTEIWARVVESFFLVEFAEKGIRNNWGSVWANDLPRPELVKRVQREIRQLFKMAIK